MSPLMVLMAVCIFLPERRFSPAYAGILCCFGPAFVRLFTEAAGCCFLVARAYQPRFCSVGCCSPVHTGEGDCRSLHCAMELSVVWLFLSLCVRCACPTLFVCLLCVDPWNRTAFPALFHERGLCA
ncbi:uncharacterized protein LOC102718783 [Oryza brachyantha]|uniref:uncharacterized protein LOC102718783 n=1 Tax=Oryza brachyantha TaxID=4533 RepID=UPI00077660A9|nr:uncharacterized protein LOC102718783 [Oryza brachyantha]